MEDWLPHARRGDRAAFEAIYRHYQPRILRFLRFRVSDNSLAEDVTAEVFVRLLQAMPTTEIRSLRAWLFRTARNLAVDAYRRGAVRDHQPLNDALPAASIMPEEAAAASERQRALLATLQRLPADLMEVVLLRFVFDMTLAEVAYTLGKTTNAIKGLQRRGIRALRAMMDVTEYE
ncbi:MAG: RNA polymerase sigma factor [Anaerolineae bacterium]